MWKTIGLERKWQRCYTSTSENDLYKSVWHRCRSLSLALCLTLRFFMHHMCGCSKYRSFDWYFPRLESMNRLVHRWSWFYSFFCMCSLQIKSKLPPLYFPATDSLLLLFSFCVSEANDGVLIAFTHLQTRGKHTYIFFCFDSFLICILFWDVIFRRCVCFYVVCTIVLCAMLAFLRAFFV